MAEIALLDMDVKSTKSISNQNNKTPKSESGSFEDIFASHVSEKNLKNKEIDEGVLSEMLKMLLQSNDLGTLNIDKSQLEEGLKSLGKEIFEKMASVLNNGLSEEDLKALFAKLKELASTKGNTGENFKNFLNTLENKQTTRDDFVEKVIQKIKNNNDSDPKGKMQESVLKAEVKDSGTNANRNFNVKNFISHLQNPDKTMSAKDLLSHLQNPDKIIAAKNVDEKLSGDLKNDINVESLAKFTSKAPEQSNVKTVNVDSPKDIFKIADLVEIAKNSSSKKLTVQLEPNNLGKMNIQLTEQAGKLTAKFFVENDIVKQIMVNNANHIITQLADKGIVIHNLDFMFMGDYESQQRFQENAEKLRQRFKNGKDSAKQEMETENDNNGRKSGIYA